MTSHLEAQPRSLGGPGDGGEAGVDDCPGDKCEGECSGSALGDGGLMLGAL